MKIINTRTYTGSNIYSHKPVVKILLDLNDLTETTTADIEGFNETLIDFFPGLNTHYCSTDHAGGFVERLYEGTLLSHVVEHLALELQCVSGYDVYFGKTRVVEEPSVYYIVYEYAASNHYCATDFGRAAVDIVTALTENKPDLISGITDRLQHAISLFDLGPSTRAIWNEAQKRHIPVRRLGMDSILQLGYGKHTRFVASSLIDTTSCISVDLAQNKQAVKDILYEHNIPVPAGDLADSEEGAVLLADQLGYPVVVKPYNGNHGKGIVTNIDNEKLLRSAYRLACIYSHRVIVEKYVEGKDFRILVVGNRVAAAAERKPPSVVGDGKSTIAALIARENLNQQRGEGHEKPLTRIPLDTVASELLARSGYTEDSIPALGEVVLLRENGNLSTGGTARDCTDEIHPKNRILAVKAAQAIGLDVAGIDMVASDISQPLGSSNGAIIEVNAVPGLRMHLHPSDGQSRNVAADILNHVYPKGTPCSVPIISITGTNGKTTVTRLIRHVLSISGKKVGMTCSSGSYIGEECVSKGDNTGPLSAHSILYNREVEVAVLETARGGIIRKGLGYDEADVGVIVNIGEDHLGLDGINTLEDLAFVKSLVVEMVKPNGYAVLNADDSLTESIARDVRCRLIYFAQQRANLVIERHINQGGIAVTAENGQVVLYRDGIRHPMLRLQEIPITFGGVLACNVENALAAISGLVALGIPEHTIRLGLRTFSPDPATNAGRFNFFDLGDFQVVLDYGHNPGGYLSVIQLIECLNPTRKVGVIGMPGDRSNGAIVKVGRISGQHFDEIYIKEDEDLRGRNPGEVASLLYEGALSGGASEADIRIIPDEIEALKTAISNAQYGNLIVMFHEHFDAAYQIVQQYGCGTISRPVSVLPVLDSELVQQSASDTAGIYS